MRVVMEPAIFARYSFTERIYYRETIKAYKMSEKKLDLLQNMS